MERGEWGGGVNEGGWVDVFSDLEIHIILIRLDLVVNYHLQLFQGIMLSLRS